MQHLLNAVDMFTVGNIIHSSVMAGWEHTAYPNTWQSPQQFRLEAWKSSWLPRELYIAEICC
jgi:hypothetical protein